MSALVFKVQYSSVIASHLYFVRVYSGEINPNKKIINASNGKREKFTKIFRVFSNKNEQIDFVKTGDIGAVLGLKFSVTGDTLVEENNNVLLESVMFPEPVVLMSVEPERSSDEVRLKEIFEIISKEDPTFSYSESKETGQLIISGMGELHLEIILTRIKDEFNLNVYTGKPQVSYRESAGKIVKEVFEFNNIFAGKNIDFKIGMIIKPLSRGAGNKIDFECGIEPVIKSAILRGITSAFVSGIFGYPIIDINVSIFLLFVGPIRLARVLLSQFQDLLFIVFFKNQILLDLSQ